MCAKLGRAPIANAANQVPRLLAPEKIINRFFHIWVWHHLGHVTINICERFPSLNLRSLHIMKFDFNHPSDFGEKDVWICMCQK